MDKTQAAIKGLHTWYYNNGYREVANNMGEILQNWRGKERILLAILTKEPFKL